ncbi:MAG: tetratricopeptide repeat protein [Chloroflexi bacterium]|nr:tetratricopeptide repeat protein [Chloroflexota bacterium]
MLCGLIDKSLVLAETRPTGEVRYRLLETLRQYAVERLHEAHEEHAVRMRQLDWLVTLTERADPVHGGPDEPPYLALVPLEYDNCRAALEWAAQTPAAATLGLKLVIRLYRYWLINGLMNEGRRWNVLLRDAVTTLGLGPSLDLAWSLFLDSTLTVFQGEFDEGQRLAEAAVAMAQVLDQPAMAAEFRGLLATQQANRGDLASAAANNAAALAVLRTTGPEASLAGTLMGAATVARLQGDDAQAIRFTEESLRIMQRIGLDFYVGHVVSGLGLLYLRRGQLDRARQYFEQALDGRRARGERTGVLGSLRDLGQVALAEGDLRSAQRYFEESLAITRELGDRSDTAQTLRALGKVSAERGDIRSGLRLLQDALRLQAELGHTLQVPDTLEDVASLAARSGQALAAVRLFAATTSARKRIGSMSDDRQAAIVRMAQRALGLHVFDAAWSAGEMLSLEDAIDEALRLEVAEPEARRSPDGGAELTPREREVAVLLASGLSNRAIADRLVISEATAEVHVRHILAKLGFSSRAQVAAWAAERGALGAR